MTTVKPARPLKRAYERLRDDALEYPGCSDCLRGTYRPADGSESDGPACDFNREWVEQYERYFNPPVPYREFHHSVHTAFGLPCDKDCIDRPVLRYPAGESITDRVKAAYRVEDIAERLTELRGYGNRLKGRCPFHKEQRGQSFTVYIDTQSWYCFGQCATGGNVITLARFAEANGLRWL